jgi:tetratricopeptide (TPR) repeat protein
LRRALLFVIIIGIAAISFAAVSFAEKNASMELQLEFKKASQLYSELHFKDAITGYEEILARGYESANIYYNLGNAYFKTGALGKAILNYERAKRLRPGDNDLRSNLEYAYSLVTEPAMDRTHVWLSRKMRNFLDYFTIDGLAASLSVIYIVFICAMTLLIFKKQLRRLVLNILAILAVIFLLNLSILSINIYRATQMQPAVVISKELNARFEPLEDATVHFKLYEGCRILVLKTRDGWSQIKREDGKIGWAESSLYEII